MMTSRLIDPLSFISYLACSAFFRDCLLALTNATSSCHIRSPILKRQQPISHQNQHADLSETNHVSAPSSAASSSSSPDSASSSASSLGSISGNLGCMSEAVCKVDSCNKDRAAAANSPSVGAEVDGVLAHGVARYLYAFTSQGGGLSCGTAWSSAHVNQMY